MFKKISIVVLFSLTLFLLTSCFQQTLKISGPNTVEVSSMIELTTNINADEELFNWSSSDESIAVVVNGKVVGMKEGIVTISVAYSEQVATYAVTVIPMTVNITLTGSNVLELGSTDKITATIDKQVEVDIIWSSSDKNIVSVDSEGNIKALAVGKATIKAQINESYSLFEVTVTASQKHITISGPNHIYAGETEEYFLSSNLNPEDDVIWSVSDNTIATINNGLLTTKRSGKVTIKVELKTDSSIYSTFDVEILKSAPSKIKILGDKEQTVGILNDLDLEFTGDDVITDVYWSSSDESKALVKNGLVLGLTEGSVTIFARSVADEDIYDSIELTFKKQTNLDYNEEDLKRVNEIINKMTLNQKIGQMFVVGFSGTTMPTNLSTAIDSYNFGNVILMGHNVSNPSTLKELTSAIQSKMISSNGIGGFISTDQEGGRVARLTSGATHIISQMALAATNNPQNGYAVGKIIGTELSYYGINVDYAPVLDVNNNPDNPIIGIRSYSDDPMKVALYGNNMFKGLSDYGVMGCAKHFPGHGNTNVDSHYGLPIINSSIEDLYKVELAPFISAINNGIDSIMTTHIIFSAIDSKLPATLSEKVLTGLLRNNLGFDGIICTDGMEMNAVKDNFGGYGDTAIQAILAGCDMLLYTSLNNPKTAHTALVNAVKNGQISEERINESVRRILLKKLKYGILDNKYQNGVENYQDYLETADKQNLEFAKQAITKIKGDFTGLDKNKSTLIISPTTSFSLGSGLSTNSFASFACKYLKSKGHTNVVSYDISLNATSQEVNKILLMIKDYDQVVIATSNVKTNNYSSTVSLVNQLALRCTDLLVIALDTPYDYLAYKNVRNYVCAYGYQKTTVEALASYLNGEFESTGVSPIDPNIFS